MINLIDKLNQQDIDFIKIHVTIDLDEYMDKTHPAYGTLKKWMFSELQWKEIINRIISGGKKPLLLLNDLKSIDIANKFNVDIVEVHSVCLNDIHLLNKIKNNLSPKTKIVLGIGGSTLYEIENAISILGCNNIVLMHGFQNYPTNYEDINLKKMMKLKQLYPQYEHGYADHCAWNELNNILITTLGASLGMNYVEKHVTTNYGEERCDWNSAISLEMLGELVSNLKIVNACYGNGSLTLNVGEKQYSQTGIMKKAAFFAKDMREGSILDESNIKYKRTGSTSDISQLDVLDQVGKPIHKPAKKDEIIKSNFF